MAQGEVRRARESGGAVFQVLLGDGPSPMQEAEEVMAKDKGVPLIKLDASSLRGELDSFRGREEAIKLEAMASKAAAARPGLLPISRQERPVWPESRVGPSSASPAKRVSQRAGAGGAPRWGAVRSAVLRGPRATPGKSAGEVRL